MNMNHKRNKTRSMSLKERTTIQLQTGATKAYVQRNPLSYKLKPIPGLSEERSALPRKPLGNRGETDRCAIGSFNLADLGKAIAESEEIPPTGQTLSRSQSEMQWTPVVNITRNNTFILPTMPVNATTDQPCLPHIEIPESDSDEDHEKRGLDDLQIDDGDRNLLLQYLKKGARPSITPMNSVDSESIDLSDCNTQRPTHSKAPFLSKPSMPQFAVSKKTSSRSATYSSNSSIRVHCLEKRQPRRPQVLTRVSIGEDLHLEFCRGSRPAQTQNSLPQRSNRASHGAKKTSLPTLPSVKQTQSKTMLRSSTIENENYNPPRFNPSDQEIINMYRKGLLSAKKSPDVHQPNLVNPKELFGSQYSSPGLDSTCDLKEESDSSKIVMTSGSSSTCSEPNIAPLPTYDARTSRGATNSNGCDSRKTSAPNCLQIPGINCPVNSCDTSESLSDGPPNWDSKSSTPFDSRPISCSSSLGDASLMLENDDIASLPCSPFPGAKTGTYHPGLRRRSSSIDSAFSRPGSDFLDIPQPSVMSSKDKVPALLDSPGESPISSPVSDVCRYSEDLQHQVVHRVSGGLVRTEFSTPRSESPVQVSPAEETMERKGSEGIVAPAVSLTTDDGDDFAVSFGRRGSIFIEEKGQPQPVPPLHTTTDEFGTVSLAVPGQRGN